MLFEKYQSLLEQAVKAGQERSWISFFPEHPKAYGEQEAQLGKENFQALLQQPFQGLCQKGESNWSSSEISPYTLEPLGISYPVFEIGDLVQRSQKSSHTWNQWTFQERSSLLVESLQSIKEKFFELAYATMHTTGQSFLMSFQASGPHSMERALEAIAMGFEELGRYPAQVNWDKPMGKTTLHLLKSYRPVPKGIGLVIGCSTFPVWNSLPGVYANLVCGNPVIIKPHPGAVLPLALVVQQ
ncbi:MAG: aldehyde dehydrogenase family protein, partial [Chitinophagaceae bacterium]